ncbi:MAG: ABC transporter permease [Candidatus Solibacter sp.]|nr:ABC transporter permease [Candidatus Solibacter sp.]
MNNFSHGVRVLAKKPGFTAAAVLVLALGIGANAAIFSLVNAFLLKPVAIHNPEELVGLYSRDTRKPDNYRAFSYPNFVDLRAQGGVFASLAAHHLAMLGLTEGDSTRRLFTDMVSSNYFDTMGVPLFRGRVFTAEEERPGSASPAVIVSYSFWKRHGADPAVLGKSLRLNGRWFTVVGITPEGFTGTTALVSAELYAPLGAYEAMVNDFEGRGRTLSARDNHALIALARLRPGATLAATDAELAGVAAAMQKAWPVENKDQTLLVRPLSRLSVSTSPESGKSLAVPAILLLCMAAVVLLIASLNVANMMLARGAARRKEIAIRLALGGGRRDIIQQLLSESLMLALLGGAAGLFIAWWSTGVLVSSMSRLAPIDMVYNAMPDLRVLAATFGFCLFSTLLFGFMPAWNLSRPDLTTDLKDGERGRSSRQRLFSRGNLLVMGQICLSLTLLTAAGLFLRSALRAADMAPGFRIANSIVVELDPALAGYNQTRGRETYRALLGRLKALPGVQSASMAATIPFGIVSNGRSIRRADSDAAEKRNLISCRSNIVDSDYFQTMGIALLRGRSFQPAEANAGTAIVLDRLAASRLWPDGDALGKFILLDGEAAGKTRAREVVGIVGNVQEHIVGKGDDPHVYFPLGKEYQSEMIVHLKVSSESGMLESVRRDIREFDAALPVLALKTMRQHMEGSADLWITRTAATLFSIFGGVALLLAVIGLYGIRSYTVARRTREIGIRMALGASAGDTLRLVVREGAALTAIGAAAGLALSVLLGKLLAGMLYQVSGADPVVFLVAPAVLSAVSLVACYIPARRAARVDPMVALRWE